MNIKGVLFDMDGVIADTAKLHFIAWKETANQLGIELDENFNEKLKGVDRITSLKLILDFGQITISNDQQRKLMEQKNKRYIELLQKITANDVLPGIKNFMAELKENNIKISIASISRNAPLIIKKLGIENYIDAVADPNKIAKPKPEPDIFYEAARLINIPIELCVGIEDATAGIEAIRQAKIPSIGIGVDGDITLKTTKELSIKLLHDF